MRVELSSRALKEGPLGGISDGGARVAVYGFDGCLDLVGPGPVAAQALADDSLALGDKRPVPARPVLVGQQDQVAVWRRAAGPAGLCQQHQREEALDLRLNSR